MTILSTKLDLERCPHCSVNRPSLTYLAQMETNDHTNSNLRKWRVYKCESCGGVTTASSSNWNQEITDYFPKSRNVDELIPEKPKAFLKQALDTVHAPSGSIMLSASSVDAMLKEKNYSKGSLYNRIDKAVNDNLLTADMAKWAHEVRLDANDQRHADENMDMPTEDEAIKSIDFVEALAQFLFVLPSKIEKGLGKK